VLALYFIFIFIRCDSVTEDEESEKETIGWNGSIRVGYRPNA